MRRVLPAAAAVLALSATLLPATATTASSAPSAPVSAAAAKAKLVKTKYLMGSSAYGTQIKGGMVPIGSADTGYAVQGCNRFAGKSRQNYVAKVNVPGLGTIDGVRTRAWTEKNGKKLKEVYELLEQTTDFCEDVADALQNVVVKNS